MLLSPVLHVAYGLQDNYGDIGMKKTSTGNGTWSSNLCVNATTGLSHNEDDCTYTVICVPLQNQSMNEYKFLFRVNDSNTIGIVLNPNTSIMFSGKLLTHRQGVIEKQMANNGSDTFINISSYGNKQLFCHIRKSFARKLLAY